MTSDGITNADWKRVKAIAAEIVNATSRDDDKTATKGKLKLLALLKDLEAKYGRKASLLATRADYLRSTKKRISLLREAHRVAQLNADTMNVTLVCSSLAELTVDQ